MGLKHIRDAVTGTTLTRKSSPFVRSLLIFPAIIIPRISQLSSPIFFSFMETPCREVVWLRFTNTVFIVFEAIAFLVIFSPCSTLAGLTTVAAAAHGNGSTYTERDLGLGALAGFIVAAIPCALGVIARLLLGEKLSKIFNILILPFCLIGVGPLVAAVISLLTIGEGKTKSCLPFASEPCSLYYLRTSEANC